MIPQSNNFLCAPDVSGNRGMKFPSMGGLAVGHDLQTGRYFGLCPRCRERITHDTLDGLYHELMANDQKCCQGCRARLSLERNPGLVGLFLDFWYRTGAFPQSSIWMEAIPQTQFVLWAKEIRAAFFRGGERPPKMKGMN